MRPARRRWWRRPRWVWRSRWRYPASNHPLMLRMTVVACLPGLRLCIGARPVPDRCFLGQRRLAIALLLYIRLMAIWLLRVVARPARHGQRQGAGNVCLLQECYMAFIRATDAKWLYGMRELAEAAIAVV